METTNTNVKLFFFGKEERISFASFELHPVSCLISTSEYVSLTQTNFLVVSVTNGSVVCFFTKLNIDLLSFIDCQY